MPATAAVPATPVNYAANPEALATMTEEQIDALANPPVETSAATVEGETTSSATPAATSQDTEKPAAPVVEQPAGVQAKDGGHIIPYSVLERERDRAARAEATAAALTEQLKQLQVGKPVAEGEVAAADLTEEDLTQLDQDLPGVAKNIRALMGKIESLTGTVQSLQQEQDVQQQTRQLSQQDVIEAAIAGNPDLNAWRTAMSNADNPDPLTWNRAADLDRVLREDPAWQDKPIADRFAKVAEIVKATYGLPTTAVTSAPPQETPQQIQARADAALAAAGGKGALPRSSSDIPGGTAPPTDELAALAGKSGPQVTADFMGLTLDQIEARLNRL